MRQIFFKLLSDRNIALCGSDHHDAPSPWEQTADFVYVRVTAQVAATRDDTHPQHLLPGAYRSSFGNEGGYDSYVYLITTKKAPRRWTRSPCSAYL
jgi:hypothetical protein